MAEGSGQQDWLGPVIAGGISVLGNSIDTWRRNKAARYNTDATIKANKEAAELAWLRSKEMWHMNNSYNSPAAQMERFKQAGLNPHLIYGQGSPGNATSMPAYHPPDIQYKYEAGNYGEIMAQTLPLMMAVGSWLQDMRLKNVQVKQAQENLYTSDLKQMQLQQLMSYLEQKNPKVLEDMSNKLSLFNIQSDAARTNLNMSNAKLQEFLHEVNWRWSPGGAKDMALQKFKQDMEGSQYKNSLLRAQSAWTDMDITNPQHLMEMVLGGAMQFLGKTVSFKKPSASGRINQSRLKKKRTRSVGRDKTEFFEYE